MILRSITKHVKDQNWFAVGLDFFIVVFGVFVGLQVQQWNEMRNDEGRAKAYLIRTQNDLNADQNDLMYRVDFWKQVSDYGTSGLDYANTGQVGSLTYWELLIAFFQASQAAEFTTTRTTYDELTNAGDQNLISVELRDALAIYYLESGNAVLSERPKYRENVRGIVPVAVQSYIWENCYGTDATGEQVILPCSAPISPERSEEIVNLIAGDVKLMAELRYWMSTMMIATIIGVDRAELATDMIAKIDTELGTESQEENQ